MLKSMIPARTGRVLLFAIIASSLLVFYELPLSYFSNYLLNRGVSVDLGNGECVWTPPSFENDYDSEKDYHKTLVAGYPGVAKRIVYQQLEALAGLPTNDEWPYTVTVEEKPNRPFWKANYPHHEGYWSWDDYMDQTILVCRNPRHAIQEYHNIRWDIDFSDKYEHALDNLDRLYEYRPSVEEYVTWREERTLREIKWWGWHIDYWMEGGLLRDTMSNKYTTAEHFFYMLNPSAYGDDGSLFVKFVGEELVPPTYDDHCTFDMTEKCQPVAVVCVDRLRNPVTGPNETAKIASVIQGKPGLNVIDKEAWPCIWEELIVNKRGPKTMDDRKGPPKKAFTFTNEQLVQMLAEIDRLRFKYDSPEWRHKKIARDLVEIMEGYHNDITDVVQGKKGFEED